MYPFQQDAQALAFAGVNAFHEGDPALQARPEVRMRLAIVLADHVSRRVLY